MATNQIDLRWCSNLAYAIGLIASDGCLSSSRKYIWLSSAEKEMIDNFKKSLGLNNKIGRYARGGEKEKRYFYIQFGDTDFYQFLIDTGLTPAKSKTIKELKIPDKFFSDFLRGLFDGDGSFYTFKDTRWPNSHGYQIAFASASYAFLIWIKQELTRLCGVKGFIRPGAGVFNLRYVKRDSIKLFLSMYKDIDNILFLTRKYDKINTVLLNDRLFNKLHMPG